MKRSSFLALLCLYAAAGQAAPNNARFLSLDANHDGYLSRDETSGIRGYAPLSRRPTRTTMASWIPGNSSRRSRCTTA